MAIGFEYELGLVRVIHDPQASQKGVLKKGTVLATHEDRGFWIKADQFPVKALHEDRFDMEIEVNAIDDLDPKGRQRVQGALEAVSRLLDDLSQRTGREMTLRTTDIGSLSLPLNLLVSSAALSNGAIQLTAGLSLDALYNILSGKAIQRFHRHLAQPPEEYSRRDSLEVSPLDAVRNLEIEKQEWGSRLGKAPMDLWGLVEQEVNHFAQTTGTLDPKSDDLRHLRAIVTLLVTIPINVRSNLMNKKTYPYPKATTGSLLARTDFAALFGLLPDRQQRAIAGSRQWEETLMKIVERSVTEEHQNMDAGLRPGIETLFLHEEDPIFPLGTFEFPDTPRYEDGLTLGMWFEGLTALPGLRTDDLTQVNYPYAREKLPINKERWVKGATRFVQDGRQQAEDLESLGGFGSKMDAVERPIFEFRTLEMLPYEYLRSAGLLFWDYIMLAHSL
jgi:hypothetical protein